MLLNAEYNTPTADLLEQTSSLSVHQMIAYQTADTTHKVVKSGKPSYIANKMRVRTMDMNIRKGVSTLLRPRCKLHITREGFVYRGETIYNKLEESLRKESKLEKFKTGVREWFKANISIRPKQIFQSISAGSQRDHPPPPHPPPPEPPPVQQRIRGQNLITRYFTTVEGMQ